jgi:SPP1 family predicted phage head-tail adaptor
MATKQIERKKSIICAGDLTKKIKIQDRVLNTNNVGVDATYTFTTQYEVWAMVKTPSAKVMFDNIAMKDTAITHEFYTRYLADMSVEKVIEYNGYRYYVVGVTNLEEESLFLRFDCVVKGQTSKAGTEW